MSTAAAAVPGRDRFDACGCRRASCWAGPAGPANPAAASGVVGARDRDRDRRDGRRSRGLGLEPGEPAGDDRQARDEPPDRHARSELRGEQRGSPEHVGADDRAYAERRQRRRRLSGLRRPVLRTSFVPSQETGGIGVAAAGDNLPQVVGTSMSSGHFLGGVADRHPRSCSARRLPASSRSRRSPGTSRYISATPGSQ